jgi:glycosyltransferase involved in cell wall biosynthesis
VVDSGDSAQRPVFAILMPCYNSAAYLPRTLRSLFEQDFESWQLVVHDGGSTDGSIDILEEYAGRSRGRMHVESSPDSGQSDALNKALRRSRGEWVGWLNADDLLLPGALRLVAAAIDSDDPSAPADVVFGSWLIIDENDDAIREVVIDSWEWDTFYRRGCYVFSGSSFIRRSAVEQLNGWDPALHFTMDFDMALRLGRPRTIGVRANLAAFRWHAEAKSSKAAWRFIVEASRVRGRYATTLSHRLLIARAALVMAVSSLTAPVRFGKTYSTLRSTKRF